MKSTVYNVSEERNLKHKLQWNAL